MTMISNNNEHAAPMWMRELYPLEPYNPTNFTPVPYHPSRSVQRQHKLPRFGHTNNFTALVEGIEGSGDMATNYIIGVCSRSIALLCIVAFLFFIIVCLKIAGQKRVGFLAGRLERPPPNPFAKGGSSIGTDDRLSVIPEEDEQATEENDQATGENNDSDVNQDMLASLSAPLIISNTLYDEREYARTEKRFRYKTITVRSVFALSGLIVIINGGLLYGKGVTSFESSLNGVKSGINLVQTTAYKAIDLTDALLAHSESIQSDLNATRSQLSDRQDLCNGKTPLAESIEAVYDQLTSQIKELLNLCRNELANFGNDLRELITLTEIVDDKLDSTDIFFYIMVAVSVILVCIILAMMTGAFFAAKDVSNGFTRFVTNVVIWPIFIFFLILAWAFATLFLAASLAGADFCIQPDQVVIEILYKFEDNFSSAIFGFAIYYISGCLITPSGDKQLGVLAKQFNVVVETTHSFSQLLMNQTISDIEDTCGLDSKAAIALQSGSTIIHNATHAANYALNEVRDILSCGSFNPIYTTFVHDAFCVKGVDGLTWIFSTTTMIALFSIAMIMFRAALYPIKESNVSNTTP